MKRKVLYGKQALKECRRLPSGLKTRIDEAVTRLADDPRPHGSIKLVDAKPDTWRLRVGDWRITYQIDDASEAIVIMHINHRREVYRRM